ncbi:MAG: class I SAM-dependent methyltransferase [Abyssibacter sp.]|uniref:class I SAM-dependent methyltransferase n=1 Tax=Abyssibacter sp. TaxID=2320200 RepID=UPI00321A3D8C
MSDSLNNALTIGPVDWTGEAMRRRLRSGRRQPLARACGLGRIEAPHILDATAGYGRDAFVLAALGAEVTLCERLAPLAASLAAGHAQALANPATRDVAARMTLAACDSRALLQQRALVFDVIYLDPMYAAPGQKALAKAPMEALRHLTEGDPDAGELAGLAWEHAKRRVVIKRSPKAPTLLDRKPSFVLKSNRVRYDIYVRS